MPCSRELVRGVTGLATEQRVKLVAKVLVHERVDKRVGDVVDEVEILAEDMVRYNVERNQRRR